MPLFSGGFAHAAVKQTEFRAERVRQRLEAGRRETQLNVRREFANVRQNAAKVVAFERALGSVEQALRGTERGVVAGTRTELARASCHYALSGFKLKEAVGGLDLESIAVVNAWLVPN